MNRAELHHAIQQHLHADPAVGSEALLTKWVLVQEFVTPAGQTGLRKITGTHDGSRLTVWDAKGLLFIALHDESVLPSPTEDDDDADQPPF